MDSLDGPALFALALTAMAAVEWMRAYYGTPPSPEIYTIAAAMAIAFLAYRLSQAASRNRRLTQGLQGERAVGQFLDHLRAKGYQVFHDIPAEGFNVDHVVIGRTGVFTVETKTWSKPSRGRAQLRFDGRHIYRENGQAITRPIEQARAQAAWLRNLLLEGTGKELRVFPIVAIPGWYIDQPRAALQDIWVLEPKALVKFLQNEPSRLDVETVRLAAFFLSRFVRSIERARKR